MKTTNSDEFVAIIAKQDDLHERNECLSLTIFEGSQASSVSLFNGSAWHHVVLARPGGLNADQHD